MSNWSKISSSNSVDDTMEHKKEWVKLKIKSCGWWIVKRKEIYRENLFGPITIGYIEIFRQNCSTDSVYFNPHMHSDVSVFKKEKMTATVVLLALISIVFVGMWIALV